MKHLEMKNKGSSEKSKTGVSLPSPPPPPPPPIWMAKTPTFGRKIAVSVTNEEIARYWRQKRMVEEDHLLAAIKAAARIRARNLTGDEYKRFEDSLEEDESKEDNGHAKNSSKNDNSKEIRVGIKDWWTKSKYAYLNQPAVQCTDTTKRRTSTYIPNSCSYKLNCMQQATSFGIF